MEEIRNRNSIALSGYSLKAFLIVAMLCLLDLSSIITYGVYFVIAIIFITIPIEMALPFYAILLPWERILSLPGAGTLTLLIQLLLLAKYINSNKGRFTGSPRLVYVGYFAIYAVISFALNGAYSGFGLLFEFLLLELLFRSKSTEAKTKIWNEIGKYYTLSLIVSCFFGVVHGLFAERWVDGLGRVPAFLGIQGANQTGFCINIAILLILTTKIPRRRKIVGLIICGGFLAATISFTSIACALLVVMGCLLTDSIDGLNPKKTTKILFAMFVMAVAVIYVISPAGILVRYRVASVFNNISSGNIQRATSGRNVLSEMYLIRFEQLPLINKLIGVFNFARSYVMSGGEYYQYSHNTFLDMLFYSGIIGIVIQIIASFATFRPIEKTDLLRKKILVLKILVIIEGFSLSIYSESFWFMWFSL